MSGVFWLLVGGILFVGSIYHMKRGHDEFNSPFLWVFLIAGLLMIGLGTVLVMLK